jgi:hypothetical protein
MIKGLAKSNPRFVCVFAVASNCVALFSSTFWVSTRRLPLNVTMLFTDSIALVSASSSTSACAAATSSKVGAIMSEYGSWE